MTAEIIERISFPHIPSASGIEIVGDSIYIVGDDSPFLFVLNTNFQVVEKIKLFDAETDRYGKIRKTGKPDLEALTIVNDDGDGFLLALGSGSIRETRDVAFMISVKDHAVKKISLVPLYDEVRSVFTSISAGELNIEGAVSQAGMLHLFQRGNISGKNLLISVSVPDFLQSEYAGKTPSIKCREIELPVLKGIASGFSGACCIPDSKKILFTASVENTLNAIDDGPALGSFIGILNDITLTSGTPAIAPVMMRDEPFEGKIESVAVQKRIYERELIVLAVCDNDSSNSDLLLLKISE